MGGGSEAPFQDRDLRNRCVEILNGDRNYELDGRLLPPCWHARWHTTSSYFSRVRFFGMRFPLGAVFWGMRTSKAHSADRMRLSLSEVFGAQPSAAVSTNADGRSSVTSQGAYKAVHQNALISGALFPSFGLVKMGDRHKALTGVPDATPRLPLGGHATARREIRYVRRQLDDTELDHSNQVVRNHPSDGSTEGRTDVSDKKDVTASVSESENPVIPSPSPKRTRPRTNKDWWPDQLDLQVLHQPSPLSDPMGDGFDYAEEFESLDLAA